MEKTSGNELVETLLIIGVGTFLIFLYIQNRLVYYIRPDYFIFTLSMGLVIFLAGVVRLISLRSFPKASPGEMVKYVLISAVIAFGVLAPSRVLSSQTAYRRGPNQTGIGGKNILKQSGNPLLGTTDSITYTVADWNRLFAIDPEPDDYIGKKVRVDGFVIPQSNDTFFVSRFVITCCAVDATPVSLTVKRPGYSFKKDEWLRVEGSFTAEIIADKRQLVVSPSNVMTISEPADPYFY